MDKSQGPTHVYVDLQQSNTNPDDWVASEVSQNYTQAVIDNPDDYDCSIVNMSIPGNGIPTLVINDYLAPGSSTGTVFEVTMTYAGSGSAGPTETYTGTVNFISFGPTLGGLSLVWNYDNFLSMVNTTLTSVTAAVNAVHTGLIPTAPFLGYNDTTSKFELWAPERFRTDGPTGTVKLIFNNVLYEMFSSLPISTYTKVSDSGEDTDTLAVYPKAILGMTGGNSQVWNSNTYYVMPQEVISLEQMNSAISLYVTSPNLPVVSEFINVSTNNLGSASGQQAAILSNFTLDVNDREYQNRVTYLPTAEYRIISMRGNQPITNVQMRFYYQTKPGNSYPLYLPPLNSLSVKLLFRRKDWRSHHREDDINWGKGTVVRRR